MRSEKKGKGKKKGREPINKITETKTNQNKRKRGEPNKGSKRKRHR